MWNDNLDQDPEPAGAEAWLYELVEDGFVLVEKNERRLGTTPFGPVELPLGSYLIILKKKGYRDTRYPVFISRNKAWEGTLRLYTDVEIGAGFVHVPAGPVICGGDEEAYNSLARSEPLVEDFAMTEHPVTMAEYLEFVTRVSRANLELAADYLVMAAWLAYLKSRLLLPDTGTEDEPSGEEMAEALAFQLRRLEAMRDAGQRLERQVPAVHPPVHPGVHPAVHPDNPAVIGVVCRIEGREDQDQRDQPAKQKGS